MHKYIEAITSSKAVTMQCIHENQLHWLRIEKKKQNKNGHIAKKKLRNKQHTYKKCDKHGL